MKTRLTEQLLANHEELQNNGAKCFKTMREFEKYFSESRMSLIESTKIKIGPVLFERPIDVFRFYEECFKKD